MKEAHKNSYTNVFGMPLEIDSSMSKKEIKLVCDKTARKLALIKNLGDDGGVKMDFTDCKTMEDFDKVLTFCKNNAFDVSKADICKELYDNALKNESSYMKHCFDVKLAKEGTIVLRGVICTVVVNIITDEVDFIDDINNCDIEVSLVKTPPNNDCIIQEFEKTLEEGNGK